MRLMKEDRYIKKFKAIRIHEPTPILSIIDNGLLINEVVPLGTICDEAVPQVHVGQYCTVVYDGYVVGEDGIKYSVQDGVITRSSL